MREELVAWNGGLYTWSSGQGGQMTPFMPVEPMEEPWGGFVLSGRCSGINTEGPAAPMECRERANPVAATGAALLRVLTVGAATYLPPRPVHFLREARFGTEGGAEVPAAPLLPQADPIEDEAEVDEAGRAAATDRRDAARDSRQDRTRDGGTARRRPR